MKKRAQAIVGGDIDYASILGDVSGVIDAARRSAARSINATMTAAYWLIGRRLVEFEQGGQERATYGEQLMERLSDDLTVRYGRGFRKSNLFEMRAFYLSYAEIFQTVSGKSARGVEVQIFRTVSGKSKKPAPILDLSAITAVFPLSWSHYAMLIRRSRSKEARAFYETEATRGGWSVRQLARQIDSQFYERTALSRNKAAMLIKGQRARPGESSTPEEEIKDPYVLEFLELKDEYSEAELEAALIHHLESFLLELGGDFCFVGRQTRLRVGNAWYRVDLIFFHRRLRCLVIVDLKIGKLTHADAGQMNLYLNFAREHWVRSGENPPVGLILCAEKDHVVAHYALQGLSNKVIATEYRMALPDEKSLVEEIRRTQDLLAARREASSAPKRKMKRIPK